MRAVGTVSGYWNRRLDPLGWKRLAERHDAERWQRAHASFLDPATADAIAWLGDIEGRRLLEVGCGQGHGTAHLARLGACVTGIDVADRRCAVARRELSHEAASGAVRLCAADAEQLPFRDGAFDLVFCRDVLMYADATRVLAECHRVLGDGGRAAFVESLDGPAPLRWFRRLTSPRDYRAFTRHLRWSELCALRTPLRAVAARPYYLLSTAAFACLFLLGSAGAYRRLLATLAPLDRRLLARVPALAGAAWRATAYYAKDARAG